jgi:hypothetical protein
VFSASWSTGPGDVQAWVAELSLPGFNPAEVARLAEVIGWRYQALGPARRPEVGLGQLPDAQAAVGEGVAGGPGAAPARPTAKQADNKTRRKTGPELG